MTVDRRRFAVKAIIVVAVGIVLLVLPQQLEAFRVGQLNRVLCFAIAALGLNLLTGFNGQISLGHGAFFGLGAYTSVILVADHGWPHLATLVVAAVLCFAVGVLIGLPALRIEGLYLALVTLALATVFPQLITRFSELTGGSQGKNVRLPDRFNAPDWTEALPGSPLANDQWRYYVFLTFAVVFFVLVRNLVHSRAGRAVISIRDNETAAETLGVNTAAYKVFTFGISALIAGVAGALFSFETSFVSPGEFTINLSITFLVAVVVGGAATVIGPAVGAFLVVFIPIWLEDFDANPQLSPVLFGASLIALMMVAPGGVMGLYRRMAAWVARRTRRAEAPPPDAPDALASAT